MIHKRLWTIESVIREHFCCVFLALNINCKNATLSFSSSQDCVHILRSLMRLFSHLPTSQFKIRCVTKAYLGCFEMSIAAGFFWGGEDCSNWDWNLFCEILSEISIIGRRAAVELWSYGASRHTKNCQWMV